jgi:hypothetical protein
MLRRGTAIGRGAGLQVSLLGQTRRCGESTCYNGWFTMWKLDGALLRR